jgi:hypothetical protein
MENISLSEAFCIGYYFSAFISAARSITFTLQASLKDVNGFPEWYKEKQTLLKKITSQGFFMLQGMKIKRKGFTISQEGKWLQEKCYSILMTMNRLILKVMFVHHPMSISFYC